MQKSKRKVSDISDEASPFFIHILYPGQVTGLTHIGPLLIPSFSQEEKDTVAVTLIVLILPSKIDKSV